MSLNIGILGRVPELELRIGGKELVSLSFSIDNLKFNEYLDFGFLIRDVFRIQSNIYNGASFAKLINSTPLLMSIHTYYQLLKEMFPNGKSSHSDVVLGLAARHFLK